VGLLMIILLDPLS